MKAETFGNDWLDMDLPFPCEIHLAYPQSSVLPHAKKILALFTEPRISMASSEWVHHNYQSYDLILTYDRSLAIVPNVRMIEFGGTWNDVLPLEKECSVSFLLSTGASVCNAFPGYDIRRDVAQTIKSPTVPVKLFFSSRGIHVSVEQLARIHTNAHEQNHSIDVLEYNGGVGKAPLFKSMFHICIENVNDDYFFTEKLIDCFRTHTVPIYWGTNKVSEFFDPEGMIIFDKTEDINLILENLTIDDYTRRMEHVKKNYMLAETYMNPAQRVKNIILQELDLPTEVDARLSVL